MYNNKNVYHLADIHDEIIYKVKNMNDKDVFGLPVKTWTKIVLFSALGILIIFLALPFLVSIVVSIVNPGFNEKYEYLVDVLDGISIVLGLAGTCASILSIFMTLADKKRFNQEKEQTKALFTSVNELHKEVQTVDKYVKRTFEQNQRLALELYNNKVIKVDHSQGVGVCTDVDPSDDLVWGSITTSGELENDKE